MVGVGHGGGMGKRCCRAVGVFENAVWSTTVQTPRSSGVEDSGKGYIFLSRKRAFLYTVKMQDIVMDRPRPTDIFNYRLTIHGNWPSNFCETRPHRYFR